VPQGDSLPQINMGSSEEVAIGDWVLAMGSPLGKALVNSVSAGIVSGKGRKSGILGQLGIEDFLQTDAVINKGNSGGPLVNIKGEIVGINSNIISATGLSTGLGFAVPSDLAKDVVDTLIKEGTVVRGYLGVSVASFEALEDDVLEDIDEDVIKKGGAYIVQVVKDGPGDEGGLEDGDIITKVDNINIASSPELIKYISSKMPDETVVCNVYRDGRQKRIKVKLGIRPGTGGSGDKAVVTSRDKNTEAYKKLGIVVDNYTEQSLIPGRGALEAVEIRTVTRGSIAEEFGLSAGDVIVEVDGERVANTSEFNEELDDADLDDGVLLNVKTGDTLRKVFIKKF
jgi:serine protease Do